MGIAIFLREIYSFSLCITMSENYMWREELKANFQLNILENTSSLHYIFKQRARTYLSLKILHKALLKWREIKQVKVNISYLELLQVTASNLPVVFKNGNERLEKAPCRCVCRWAWSAVWVALLPHTSDITKR